MNFRKILQECGADTLVFFTDGSRVDGNFYYFTGLSKTIQATSTVIVTKSGPVIITNRLEAEIFGGKGKIIVIEKRADAERAMEKYNEKTVGMDFSSITVAKLKHFRKVLHGREIIDVSKKLESVRSIKSNGEIRNIREACKITEEILAGMDGLLKKSRTEKDLVAELEYAAKKSADGVSFPPIVAIGKNSAVPHHLSGMAKLNGGLLLVDFGAVFRGYCSDITRVFYLGKANKKSKNVYECVYSAQQAAINAIKNGAKASDVHIAADKIIQTSGQKLIHSIGHGLGIDVHESPAIGENSSAVLKNNMIVTAEPGYYKNGWGGIRIEDDILVGKKAILLSRAPSSLIEI